MAMWAQVTKYSRVFCGLVDDVDAVAAFVVVLIAFVVNFDVVYATLRDIVLNNCMVG